MYYSSPLSSIIVLSRDVRQGKSQFFFRWQKRKEGGNELRVKIWIIENNMDFCINKLARMFVHYPCAVHT
jgi:hypothetical protein